jgi:hydrogenase 3 maturation protease
MSILRFTSPINQGELRGALAGQFVRPVAVVAMGNPYRGDDAAALHVIEGLQESPELRIFNVETAPESFLVPVASCGARVCLLLDALDAGGTPGDIILLAPEDLEETDFTTHGLSPKAFLQALGDLSGMKLLIIGLQPGPQRDGEQLSPQVECAAAALRSVIVELAGSAGRGGHGRRTSGSAGSAGAHPQ